MSLLFVVCGDVGGVDVGCGWCVVCDDGVDIAGVLSLY